jgi:hypothetical protein
MGRTKSVDRWRLVLAYEGSADVLFDGGRSQWVSPSSVLCPCHCLPGSAEHLPLHCDSASDSPSDPPPMTFVELCQSSARPCLCVSGSPSVNRSTDHSPNAFLLHSPTIRRSALRPRDLRCSRRGISDVASTWCNSHALSISAFKVTGNGVYALHDHHLMTARCHDTIHGTASLPRVSLTRGPKLAARASSMGGG